MTDHMPKCMVSIHGKPFIHYSLRCLKNQDVVMAIKEKDVCIKEWCKENDYWFEYVLEPFHLGSGGALIHARPFLENNKHFTVLNGDTFININPSKIISNLTSDVGIVLARDKIDNKLKHSGMYLFKKAFWKHIKDAHEYKDNISLDDLIADMPKTLITVDSHFLDIGTNERLKFAKTHYFVRG